MERVLSKSLDGTKRKAKTVKSSLVIILALNPQDNCTVVLLAVSCGAVDDVDGSAGIMVRIGVGSVHHRVIVYRIQSVTEPVMGGSC